jgi:hypothetical protein
MNEIFAIITVCGHLHGKIDCIRIQQRGSPSPQYECQNKLLELQLDFETMRDQLPQFRNYVLVEQGCYKEPLHYGHKPSKENT